MPTPKKKKKCEGVHSPLKEARFLGGHAGEKKFLKKVLIQENGHVCNTAEALGISPQRLHTLLNEHNLRDFARKLRIDSGLFSETGMGTPLKHKD